MLDYRHLSVVSLVAVKTPNRSTCHPRPWRDVDDGTAARRHRGHHLQSVSEHGQRSGTRARQRRAALHGIDSGVQQFLILRKVLRAAVVAREDHRGQISRAKLIDNRSRDLPCHRHIAFSDEQDVIENDQKRPRIVDRVGGDVRAEAGPVGRPGHNRPRGLHLRHRHDGLTYAIDRDLEVISRQAANRTPAGIQHADVHPDDIHTGGEPRRYLRLFLEAWLSADGYRQRHDNQA